MRHAIVRLLFDHRAIPQRAIRRLVPEPVCIPFPDFKLFVRLDDWAIGARIALKRSYEPHVSRVMRTLLKPGMTMIDIGANIGYFSMLAVRAVGASGRVLAFEPSRNNLQLLSRSAAANGFANVEIHELAVAQGNGPVSFGMEDSNGGISREEIGVSAEWVRAVKLDDFLPHDRPIHLVKIDIEGCEGLAIQGMSTLLSRHRPILFSEFTPAALPRFSCMSADEYLDLLRQLGYQLRVIPYAGELPSAQSNREIMQSFHDSHNDHVDLLARPL